MQYIYELSNSHTHQAFSTQPRVVSDAIVTGIGTVVPLAPFSTQPRVVSDAIVTTAARAVLSACFQYSTTSRKRCNILMLENSKENYDLSVLNHES